MAVPKVDGQFIAEGIKYIDENGKSKICFNRKSLPMFGGTVLCGRYVQEQDHT